MNTQGMYSMNMYMPESVNHEKGEPMLVALLMALGFIFLIFLAGALKSYAEFKKIYGPRPPTDEEDERAAEAKAKRSSETK